MSGSSSDNSNQRHLRRSERQIIPRRRFEIEGHAFLQSEDIFLSSSPDNDEPRNINEALSSPANQKWKIALDEEINSIHVNQV